MKLHVTGFGPFLSVTENPSSILAKACGFDYTVLEVSFRAVDQFLENPPPCDALVMLGVHRRARCLHLETLGRNWVGPTPDVRGHVRGPAQIAKGNPDLPSTLWRKQDRVRPGSIFTENAGDYLCNYILFRALQVCPTKVGFIHVPRPTTMPIEKQQAILDRVLQNLAIGRDG